jgi:hypothetical protein
VWIHNAVSNTDAQNTTKTRGLPGGALHRCATRDSGFEPGLNPPEPGRDILVSSHTSDSCGGPGAAHADQFARCTVFPPTHWCSWLPGRMRAVLRSSAAWLGCVSEDAWLSTFVYPEPVREL